MGALIVLKDLQFRTLIIHSSAVGGPSCKLLRKNVMGLSKISCRKSVEGFRPIFENQKFETSEVFLVW